MKAIAVLRVSTTSQQIDDQRDELFAYIRSMGYDEIIPVEAIGASAVKLDEKYMKMAEEIKQTILKGGIDAVCVWELSRLGRNEVILMDFKEFFIEHKIQFISKNPTLKLLNDDGSVNSGVELAFSLFATMAKQEAKENKERFARAKRSNAAKGKYIGGNTLPYGYRLVDKTTFVENQEEVNIIRLVFEMYSTGEYSAYSLAKELTDRGYDINARQIIRIIGNIGYTGESIGTIGIHYPQIISREVFDKCREIRQNNKLDMKRGERIVLGRGIIKCPVCGGSCSSNSKRYICSRNAHHGPCPNSFGMRQDVANELLYRFSFGLHLRWLMNLNEGKMEEYREELKIVDRKIEAAEKKVGEFLLKKDRIVETYMEGLIDRKNRDLRLKKVEDDMRVHRDFLNSLEGRKMAIMGLLEKGSGDTVENFIKAVGDMSLESQYDIIHKHIKTLVAEKISYGKRDPRCKTPNAVHITITSVYDTTAEYLYFPRYYDGANLYVLADGEWVEDSLERKAVYAMPLD